MSSVLEYYQERAERLNLCSFPNELCGEPIELLPDDQALGRKSDQRVLATVNNRYLGMLRPVLPFLTEAAIQQPDQRAGTDYAARSADRNMQYLRTWIKTCLFPKKLDVGSLSDIHMAAVARHDIEDSILERAKPNLPHLREPESEDCSAYFITTGKLLVSKRVVGPMACLTVVNVSHHPIKCVPHYFGAPSAENELIAKQELRRSRGNLGDRWRRELRNPTLGQTRNNLEETLKEPRGRWR